jgi:succinate-semialdehyde dehydrogenase/glutarate-semialdehyde dehydrogenase
MKNSSSTVKNLTLELGGNAPFIVLEDADVEEAIDGFILAKFRNAGQTCISANRLFVHEQIFEKFINILISRVKKLKIGNGLLNNDIGPLISKKAIEKVESHMKDAVNKGAKILLGGKKHFLKGLFFEPTIITQIKKNMKVFSEENFGPIIPIISFKKIDEVLQKSNDTTYGLAAYFYSKDSSKIWELISNLDYGMIGINSGKISSYLNAFGGFKESGLGREGSTQCLEPFLETKFITWNT